MGDLMEWLTRCRTDQEDIYIISSGRELYTSINYIFSKVANKKMLTAPKTNSRCGDLKPEEGSPKLSVMFCTTRFQAMRGIGAMIEKGSVLFLFQIWRASLYSAGSVNRLTTSANSQLSS